MAVLYISEAEAVRDIASLLDKVRAGTEIVIEHDGSTVALLSPVAVELEEPEPGHDEWFRAEVAKTEHNDPSKRLDEEEVEAIMAEMRNETLSRLRDHAA